MHLVPETKKAALCAAFFVVREPATQCVALLVAGAGVETLAMELGENLPR
jgi:hypothetical protein